MTHVKIQMIKCLNVSTKKPSRIGGSHPQTPLAHSLCGGLAIHSCAQLGAFRRFHVNPILVLVFDIHLTFGLWHLKFRLCLRGFLRGIDPRPYEKAICHINPTSWIRKENYVKKPECPALGTGIDDQRGFCDPEPETHEAYSGFPTESRRTLCGSTGFFTLYA